MKKNNVLQFPTNKKPKEEDINEVLDVIRQLYLDGEIQALVWGAVMDVGEETEEEEPLQLHIQSAFLFNEEKPEIALSMLRYLTIKLEEETGCELEEDVTELEVFSKGEND